jgi:hypothetical protein
MNRKNNPLNFNPRKSFSQFDEDGITLEILKRVDVGSNPNFLEIGVGNGLENNTLLLATLGWHGVWIGDEDLNSELKIENRILFVKKLVSIDFIKNDLVPILNKQSMKNLELISIDVDSLDYYFIREILKLKIRPSIFVVEYNASFIPPINFIVEFEEPFRWQEDNYFGASLSAWNGLMNEFGYTLVACSLSGANAFYVRNDFLSNFTDVPQEIDDLYNPPNYFLKIDNGHKMSTKSINYLI